MAHFAIPSETHSTRSNLKDLFLFLGDFKNFSSILPEDKVENFTFADDHCSFDIRGITTLRIRRSSAQAFERLEFVTEGTAQFSFVLGVYFEGQPEQPGQCRIELSGELNPFIKAMAEKPLTKLVSGMALQLSQLVLPKHEN